MMAVAPDERLAYLTQSGYNASEVQATFLLFERWLKDENRRAIRDFGALFYDLGSAFGSAFGEWFDGEPANSLALAVLKSGVRDPGLALAYSVSELCDELRAARNLAIARLHIPDWETMPDLLDDGFARRLDQAYSGVDAETWPVY